MAKRTVSTQATEPDLQGLKFKLSTQDMVRVMGTRSISGFLFWAQQNLKEAQKEVDEWENLIDGLSTRAKLPRGNGYSWAPEDWKRWLIKNQRKSPAVPKHFAGRQV